MDTQVRSGAAYGFEAFILDPLRRTLTHSGVPVTLSATLFDTLLYLVEHPARVVSKDELLDAVWPRKVVEEANVSQTIYTLRKALSAAGGSERAIVTAPGQGYRFALPVETLRGRLAEGQADSAPRWGRASGLRVAGASFGARYARAIIGACIVLAMLSGLFIGVQRWRTSRTPHAHSLVVLAEFQNLTGEAVFDRTLGRVLEIDLDQSPQITALSGRQMQDTLDLMARSKDTPISPAIAAEICVRNNGQAVVEGSLAAVGAKYLLTLNAQDCARGQALAAEKAQVDGREAVVPALDRLIAQMRRKLGESQGAIDQFSVPLANERTSSLAAIKAFSEASYVANRGDSAEAIALYRHAIDLDPNFAAAYNSLAAMYYNENQKPEAQAAMVKAFALRNTANEELRLNISILYNSLVSNDYNEVVRSARAMTEVYPHQASAWINLSNAENWLGQYVPAIDAGRHAVGAAPKREASYVVLARALMHAGRLDEAAQTLVQANAKGVAGGQTAALTMEVDIARGDSAAIAREVQKAAGKPFEPDVLALAARDAYRRGQVRRGDEIYTRVAELLAQQGASDGFVGVQASDLSALGLKGRARGLLANSPPDADPMNDLLTLATVGESARAEAGLERDLRQKPSDTLMNAVLAPLVRATLALQQGRPEQAIEDLQPTLPYEARDNDTPYLRGQAYLAVRDGAHAAIEFRKILDQPGVEPADVLRPLAQLGLARAWRLQNNRAESLRAYQALFAIWKDADPELPPLKDARIEYAGL